MDAAPIAIVGVSCRFAGTPHPGAFWRMIMHQASGIAPLGEELSLPYGGKNLFDSPYPTHGALLGKLYSFLPREQDVPNELSLGENQDRYFAVQLAFDALEDAGLRSRSAESVRGTVRFGYAPPFNASTMNWLQHTFFVDQTMEIIAHFFRNAPQDTMQSVRSELVNSLPAADPASFLSGSGNRIASGIARECHFSGGATTLDGGALSGIAAIRAAMDDLRSGRADVALAGALTPPLSRPFLEGVSGEVQFAADGELVPFSRDAHGTVPGEGGAFFVLKREQDALAAHDRIYALVKGVACGSAPLAILLQTAADRANAPLSSIDLIEADGSGVPSYDAAEVDTVQSLWGEHRPGGPLVGIGSVKGNVGHCFRAAAAAAILKVALALRRRVLPPQVPCAHPIEALSNVGSSVYLLNEARPWITGDSTSPRRAAVIVNDEGGRRAALVFEEETEKEDRK